MLPFKLVYHPRYDLNLGAHVFPSQKFRLIAEKLLSSKIAERIRFSPSRTGLRRRSPSRPHAIEWVAQIENRHTQRQRNHEA